MTVDEDRRLLIELPNLNYDCHDEGLETERYTIYVRTHRGERVVDFQMKTGYWQVRNGRASGHGIYTLGRYFQLIERKAET